MLETYSMQEQPIKPINLEKTDASIFFAELKEVNGIYEYTVKGMMSNQENSPGIMDGTGNDLLRSTFTKRVNELIKQNPQMKNLKFEVSAGFGGGYKGTIKLMFEMGDKPSGVKSIDSFGFFAGGRGCKGFVDAKFGNSNSSPSLQRRDTIKQQYSSSKVEFPRYVIDPNQKATEKVIATNSLGGWKYTESDQNPNGDQTFAFYRVDFALISGEASILPDRRIKPPKAITYPDRSTKLSEGYDRLTSGEKAFLGIVARKVEKSGQTPYKLESDGKGENVYAKAKIEKIRDMFISQGYELKISSSYRSPQKQFEEFFKSKASILSIGTIEPLSNFIPLDIINDDGTAKVGYGAIYNKFLEEYVKRAEYIAPPGYSEHQTGKAFDMKILCTTGSYQGREVMLGDTNLLPGMIHAQVSSELTKAGFLNSYARESRHWKYTK